MIIHLEATWNDSVLEQLALIISQHSIHFALQLNWILVAAIEDYQPETPSGETNPKFNALYYSRCIKLLSNIERCVVYGTPRRHQLQRLYEKRQITKEEYTRLEQSETRFNAANIITDKLKCNVIDKKTGNLCDADIFGGDLLYKRLVRQSRCKTKQWKTRYFAVFERTLYCYNIRPSEGGRLIRAMPLEGAKIQVTPTESAKYMNMFEVHNMSFFFRMRAKDNKERLEWMNVLKEESESNALFPSQGAQGGSQHNDSSIIRDLSSSQKMRYDFLKTQRDFVRSLCNIAEELRFMDPPTRKIAAPDYVNDLVIPSCVYIPQCNSTDFWRRVETAIGKETRVFNTKERCPLIVYFLVKRGEVCGRQDVHSINLDVAEFMRSQYEVPDQAMIDSINNSDMMTKVNEEVEPSVSSPSSTDDEEENSSPSPMVWSERRKYNYELSTLIREKLTKMPKIISNALRKRKQNKSQKFIEEFPMDNLKIVQPHSHDDDDDASVYSSCCGSIMIADGEILHSGKERDGIDFESLDRAKVLICGSETWEEKSERMLHEKQSQLSDTGACEINGVMVKSNDDLRQEVFVMQMIHYYKSVFINADLPIWLKTYRILSTSQSTGLIEILTDATSIDSLKQHEKFPKEGGLRSYFEYCYGKPSSQSFKAAQRNFMLSLVGYSLVSYFLGLKDRHNGNIMIDTRGRIIHIDFGFAFGMAPGHEFSFERAPFKMTSDYVKVMGGKDSSCFQEFRELFVSGFKAARSGSQIALGLVEIMMYESKYPCFSGHRYGGGKALEQFQEKLMLETAEKDLEEEIVHLIE